MDQLFKFSTLRFSQFDSCMLAHAAYYTSIGTNCKISPNKALESYTAILYPFVEGRHGYEASLPAGQWVELGAALRRVHTAILPPDLARRIRRETYSPEGRASVKASLYRAESAPPADPIARRMVSFLRAKRTETLDLVGRAEQLARVLEARPPEFTLCHSDIHAGNILIAAAGDTFYIVDWDEPILAPKERDLMSIGAGLMGRWWRPEEEEALFYQGYGDVPVDAAALAYYRYERIVQDIAVECQHISSIHEGSADREQSLQWLISNFAPGNVIELAYRADATRGGRDQQPTT